MAIPELVPIMYEPDYRTSSIGTYEDGQFFGSVTAVRGQRGRHLVPHRLTVPGD